MYASDEAETTFQCVWKIQFIKDFIGWCRLAGLVVCFILQTCITYITVLVPYYKEEELSLSSLLVYVVLNILTVLSLVKTVTTSPGKVSSAIREPVGNVGPRWKYCGKCSMKCPPKAAHCLICKQCTLRKDTHNTWMNTCIGERNHHHYIQLNLYGFLTSAYTLLMLWQYHHWMDCQLCDPMSIGQRYGYQLTIVDTAMSAAWLLVSIFVLITQFFYIMKDTGHDEWTRLYFETRKPDFDLTTLPKVKMNVLQTMRAMCGHTLCSWWLLPCHAHNRRVLPPVTAIV